MIFLLVVAAVVVGAPLIAAVLVTVASLHEDSARSLAGSPPGPLAAAARRLLCLRIGGSSWRKPRATKPADESFMSQVYPYLPAPRSAADDDAAGHTLTLPRT